MAARRSGKSSRKVPGSSTSVTRYKTSTDKSIEVVKQNIGFRIVGAGVSTCVPLASNPK